VSVAFASRHVLGQPLRRTPPPSRERWAAPEPMPGIDGHYPAFSTTTSRLTPRRASLRLSRHGYGFSYRPGRPVPPDQRPGHQPTVGTHAHHRLLGPCEVSLDHPDGVVAACQPQPPPDAPDRQVVPPHGARPHRLSPCDDRGPRLPVCAARRHVKRPSSGSLLVLAHGLVSAPSAPPVTRTHWASTTELQRPKLRKDSHLLTIRTARRTRAGAARVTGRLRGTASVVVADQRTRAALKRLVERWIPKPSRIRPRPKGTRLVVPSPVRASWPGVRVTWAPSTCGLRSTTVCTAG
jgi:hypothetical protein